MTHPLSHRGTFGFSSIRIVLLAAGKTRIADPLIVQDWFSIGAVDNQSTADRTVSGAAEDECSNKLAPQPAFACASIFEPLAAHTGP
jgi:hypothetical protein